MTEEAIKCSFCGKAQTAVNKMVAGPRVYICDECVLLCVKIVLPESSAKDIELKFRKSSVDEVNQDDISTEKKLE